MKDANANLTQYLFDALNRSTVTIDALSYRTTQFFDAAGNLTGLKDASNNLTTFAYDSLNRLIDQTDPLSFRSTFTYNAIGLMSSTTNRMRLRRDFQYDAANHLTTETWYDSGGTGTQTLSYSFDANGNRLTMGNSNGAYTLTYDALNRVTVAKDMWAHTLTFTYDAVGNRTKVQDSQGGMTTSVYDVANNLVTRLYSASGANPLRIDLTYNAVNQIETEKRYGDLTGTTNVAYSTFTYDVINRVSNLQHRKGSDNSNIANYTYTYDAGGRVTTEVLNGTTKTYTYDTTDQLTADGTITFTYDGTGNRTNGSWTAGTDNRLSSDGTWTYTYNDEGDLSKKSKGASLETWTYGYDAKNELILVEKHATDGGTLQMRVDYQYDALGNRIQKSVDNNGDGVVDTTQRYAYDGWKTGPQKVFVGNENWDVWADLDGNNNLAARYLRGDVVDQLFARVESGATYWELTDRLGSIRRVIDGSGVIKDDLAYDGFGNITSFTNCVATPTMKPPAVFWEGELSSPTDYLASGLGGAAAGETLLYTGPVTAGAVGGVVSRGAKQLFDGKGISAEQLVIDGGLGALGGMIPGPKIYKVSGGRGNYDGIYKQIVTKYHKGTISHIRPQTAAKMFVGKGTGSGFIPGAFYQGGINKLGKGTFGTTGTWPDDSIPFAGPLDRPPYIKDYPGQGSSGSHTLTGK